MKVLKIKENKDGSTTIDYELSEFDLKVIKRVIGIKRLTKKQINKFIYGAIMERIELENKKGVK